MFELDCLEDKAKENVISLISRMKEIVRWISCVTGEDIDPQFMGSLSCGQVLCRVVNALSPTVITRNQIKSKGVFSLDDNINRFSKAVTTVYHIKQYMVPTLEDITSKNIIKVVECIEEVILYGIKEGLSDCSYNPNFDDDYSKEEVSNAIKVLKFYRPMKSLATVKKNIASTQEVLAKRLEEKRLISEKEESNILKNEEQTEQTEQIEKEEKEEKKEKEKSMATDNTKGEKHAHGRKEDTHTEIKEESNAKANITANTGENEETQDHKEKQKEEQNKQNENEEKATEKETHKKKKKSKEKEIKQDDTTDEKEKEEKEEEGNQEKSKADQDQDQDQDQSKIQEDKAAEAEAKKNKDMIMRKCVAEELLSSEEKYYRYVKLIVDAFYNPIKKKGSIPLDTIKAIFSSIDVIAASSKRLIDNIRPSIENWSETTLISKHVMLLANISKLYISYVGNYCRVLETLEKVSKNKEWNDFCQKTEAEINKNERSPLHIASLLIMPVQRVPRYVLLVKEFIKHTPEDNPEYADLVKAFEELTKTGKYINDKRETAENSFSTWKFRHLFAGKENLTTPSRYFVRHCHIITKEKNKQANRHLFLFNDLIIISEPYDQNKSKKLKIYAERNIQSTSVQLTTETIKDVTIYFLVIEDHTDAPKEKHKESLSSLDEKKADESKTHQHSDPIYIGFLQKADAEKLDSEIKSLKEKIDQQHESFIAGKNDEAKKRVERSKSVILPRGVTPQLEGEPDTRRLISKIHSRHNDKSQTLRASASHSHSHSRLSSGSAKRRTLREKGSKKSDLTEESIEVEEKQIKETNTTEDEAALSEKKKKKEKASSEQKRKSNSAEPSKEKEQSKHEESLSKETKKTKKSEKSHEATTNTEVKEEVTKSSSHSKEQPEAEKDEGSKKDSKEKSKEKKHKEKRKEEEKELSETPEQNTTTTEVIGDPETTGSSQHPDKKRTKHKKR